MGNLPAKVVLLGNGAVGKTSLVRRFVEQMFDDKYIPTIGVNVKRKELPDLDLTLMIWDLYGQKLSSNLHATNYEGARGGLIVFDLSRKGTFHDIDKWIEELYDVTGEVPIVVIGNKVDLINNFDIWVSQDGDVEKKFERFIHDNHQNVVEYYKKVYGQVPNFERVVENDVENWLEKKRKSLDFELTHYLTSAKTGENVEDAFRKLGELILEGEKG